MAKRHVVEVVEAFEHRINLGALVVDGQVIDQPKQVKHYYSAGKKCEFMNKKSAEEFCKVHGDKVRYLGKV